MATQRNKRKLAALNKENCEEHPRSNLAQNTNVPRSQDFISQVSEEIKGKVTKKLSKVLSKTESRFLGALSQFDEFLLNPRIRGHSGDISERTWHKPRNKWGRLPDWSSSWSVSQSDYVKLWPRWRLRQPLSRTQKFDWSGQWRLLDQFVCSLLS